MNTATLRNLTGFFCRLILLSSLALIEAQACNKSECPGPVLYYEEIGCKPIYKNDGDCCAVSYDCSHLDARKEDKCYLKHHEYAIGQSPRDEDKGVCDIGCVCRGNPSGRTQFICAVVDCPYEAFQRSPPGCYLNRSVHRCCGELICPKPNEPATTCQVGGKNYSAGNYFNPPSQADKSCYCLPGFSGEFVEPFCKKIHCGFEIHRGEDLKRKCVPVYGSFETPSSGCSIESKCPNHLDYVVQTSEKNNIVSESSAKCTFGNLTLNVGEELRNSDSDYSSQCLRCQCEIPPFLTCRKISDEECGYKTNSKYDGILHK